MSPNRWAQRSAPFSMRRTLCRLSQHLSIPDDKVQPQTPRSPRNNHGLDDEGGAQSALYGILPPFQLSSSRSTPYNHRTLTSPHRTLALPIPPKSDQPLDSFDPFNIYTALTAHPELIFELAKCLSVEDLISLYTISKDFHFIVNGHFTTIVLSQSITKAPGSSQTFHYKCYKNLCITDPAARVNIEAPKKLRRVLRFRWLCFILHRERVINELLACLTAEGHRLSKHARSVLKKIWFTMDLGDNARRIGLIHNKIFWNNKDLFVATMFSIKLDMRFTEPIDGNGEMSLRRLLLARRSLSTLLVVLQRKEMVNELECFRCM